MENPLKYFAEVRDPRVERNREHLLEEILLIAIAAVLSGAESWNDMEDYGQAKLEWLKTFLTLPSGIPSHDTFNRVFAALDPDELEKGFVAWVSSIAKLTAGEVVSIDGKALCGTRERGKKSLVHMVSAWANTNNLVLAQRKVEEKSNEITAIPKLLAALELSGTIVTIDAIGCQRQHRTTDRRQAGGLCSGGQRESRPPAGTDPGFVSNASRRCGSGAGRLRPWTRGEAYLLGHWGLEPGGEGYGMGVVAGVGADRGRALSQGHRQKRTRNALLHHQPQA